jgi:glyoxylase-like metal-dependent hydrolase (beta-lactamase superfamily II)
VVAPSGVVTFVFTDVEGSTRRWETDAEGMRAALAAHDEVLREAIETHGGYLFKHTGDGVCAAFSSPRSVVDAAVAAQRALELPVRMGIATGAAICYGEAADIDYPVEYLRDGQRLDLGEVCLEIRATPGHTPESISVVVYEHADDPVPYGVLTADTMFIGDVGRPDLLSAGATIFATKANGG